MKKNAKNTKKKYSVKNQNTQKLKKNKKTAVFLLISFVALFSVYFGMLRAGLYVIQEVFILSAFASSLLYVVLCAKIASLREKESDGEKEKKIDVFTALSKKILIILIPIVFALLIDYMLIVLGFAEKLGI